MNELIGLEPPTPVQPAPTPTPTPAPASDNKTESAEPAQSKIILGYCTVCNKAVSHNEYKVNEDGVGVICNDCFNERVAARKANIIKDRKSDFKRGLIWGGIALTLGLLLGLIVGLSGANMGLCDAGTTWLMIGMGALLGYMVSSLVAECIWDGSAFDVLSFFFRSFQMPGIIFSWSWDGIKFLIAMKILFAILSAVLSVACFLVGVVVSSIYASIIFPFSLIATVKGLDGEENTL